MTTITASLAIPVATTVITATSAIPIATTALTATLNVATGSATTTLTAVIGQCIINCLVKMSALFISSRNSANIFYCINL